MVKIVVDAVTGEVNQYQNASGFSLEIANLPEAAPKPPDPEPEPPVKGRIPFLQPFAVNCIFNAALAEFHQKMMVPYDVMGGPLRLLKFEGYHSVNAYELPEKDRELRDLVYGIPKFGSPEQASEARFTLDRDRGLDGHVPIRDGQIITGGNLDGCEPVKVWWPKDDQWHDSQQFPVRVVTNANGHIAYGDGKHAIQVVILHSRPGDDRVYCGYPHGIHSLTTDDPDLKGTGGGKFPNIHGSIPLELLESGEDIIGKIGLTIPASSMYKGNTNEWPSGGHPGDNSGEAKKYEGERDDFHYGTLLCLPMEYYLKHEASWHPFTRQIGRAIAFYGAYFKEGVGYKNRIHLHFRETYKGHGADVLERKYGIQTGNPKGHRQIKHDDEMNDDTRRVYDEFADMLANLHYIPNYGEVWQQGTPYETVPPLI